MYIREETPLDTHEADELLRLAFGGDEEVKLTQCLRGSDDFLPALSFLAVDEGNIIGCLYFTPLGIAGHAAKLLALAPMAVRPSRQKEGWGSMLVKEGLARAAQTEYDGVVVLGHPAYYPRFGFLPASRWGIRFPYEVPSEALMALELKDGGLEGKEGTLQYAACFGL